MNGLNRFCTTCCAIVLLAGCSERSAPAEDYQLDAAGGPEEQEKAAEKEEAMPSPRPVRIGEDGPRLDACAAVGRIQGLNGRTLDLREAPFDSARTRDRLKEGQLVWICSRSLDQQWMGIVYGGKKAAAKADGGKQGDGSKQGEDITDASDAPVSIAGDGPGDCGVSSPVRHKRSYDGPCQSGWVDSTFVKLVAG